MTRTTHTPGAKPKPKYKTKPRAPKRKAPKKPAAPPLGRPSDYHPSFRDIAADACARGATVAEVAEILGVHRSTVYRWAAQYQDFCDAIRIAREIADERVGFSLYERAVGYTYHAVKIVAPEGGPRTVTYVEHVPPDVAAAKFWLQNRQPDKWRDVARTELTGRDGNAIAIDAGPMSDLEVARRIAFLFHRAALKGTDDRA